MYRKRTEIFDANLVYFILIALFVVIRIISSTFKIDTVVGYVLNFVIQIGLMFSFPVFIFSALRKQKIKTTIKTFGFNKINIKAIILSILCGVLVYGLTICISSFFNLILSLFGYDPSYGGSGESTSFPVWLLFVELFFTAILPGICEEVAHRGMLLSSYKKMGIKKAILLSGLLFGLMHLNVNQFFYATLIGFLFGFVAIGTDSIFPTMIMHFVNNALSVSFTFARANNHPLGNMLPNLLEWFHSVGPLVAFLIIFLIISLMLLLLGLFVSMLIKQTRIQKLSSIADDVVKQQLRQNLFEGTSLQDNKDSTIDGVNVDKKVQNGQRMVFNISFLDSLFFKKPYKATFKDNIFLYATLFLGITLTLCTFIWGII